MARCCRCLFFVEIPLIIGHLPLVIGHCAAGAGCLAWIRTQTIGVKARHGLLTKRAYPDSESGQGGKVAVRKHLRPCEASAGGPGSLGHLVEHQGIAPCIPVWKTGVCLSTLMPGEVESRAGIAPAFAALQAAA